MRTAMSNPAGKKVKKRIIKRKLIDENHAGAEKMPVESEEQFRQFFDNAPVYCYILSPAWKILDINKSALNVLGYRKEEIVGKPVVTAVYAPSSRRRARALFKKWKETGWLKNEELTIQCKNGGKRTILLSVDALRDGEGRLIRSISIQRDITERKSAEEALQESEKRYRDLFESAPDAIFLADPETGIILDANPAASDLLRKPHSEIVGLHQSQLHPQREEHYSREIFKEHVEGFFQKQAVRPVEISIIQADGTEIPVEVRTQVVNIKGKPVLQGVFRDITERRQFEEALRRREMEYRLLVENQNDLIIKLDRKYRLLFLSPNFCSTFGKTEEELLGKKFLRFIHKEDINTVKKSLAALFDKPYSSYHENRALTKDGLRWIAWSNRAVFDERGGVKEIIAVGRDITEKRKIEERLRFTQFAIDRFSDAAFWMGPDARFIYVNEAACRSLGYTRDELLSMTVHDIDPGFPPERWQDHWREVKKHGSFNMESRHRARDGRIFPVDITVNFVVFEGREYNCAFAHDISDRKEAEEERTKLQEQLFQSQKMESIGRLAGGIAHDFNNILTSIMGNAELLQTQISDADINKKRMAGVILSGAERAAVLTKQLLGFARGGKYEPVPLNINAVIQETIKVSEKIFEKNIMVEYDLDENIYTIEADRHQLDQVLTNLFINAKDAMPDGGKLLIRTESAVLDEQSTAQKPGLKPNHYVMITISDTGTGIPEGIIDHIFEPFYTTKEKTKGIGLGLATVYGIIKNHNGYIDVTSVPGAGTTFTLYFPVSGKDVVKTAEEAKIERGNATILVVDDEDQVRILVEKMLHDLGYRVYAAADGIEAVEMYRRYKSDIDLILLDMIMPNLAGKEAYAALRKINPKVKVILSSGYSQDGKAAEILGNGILGFIQKPFRLHELSSIICNSLNNSCT